MNAINISSILIVLLAVHFSSTGIPIKDKSEDYEHGDNRNEKSERVHDKMNENIASEGDPRKRSPTEGDSTEEDTSEGGPTEEDTSEGGPSEATTIEGGPTEEDTSEGGPTEVGASEGGPTEGGTTEVGTTEVGTTEWGLSEEALMNFSCFHCQTDIRDIRERCMDPFRENSNSSMMIVECPEGSNTCFKVKLIYEAQYHYIRGCMIAPEEELIYQLQTVKKMVLLQTVFCNTTLCNVGYRSVESPPLIILLIISTFCLQS